jgi:hypothetical protein
MIVNKVKVVRDTFLADCTLGKVFVNDSYVCETLEDFVREIPGKPTADWKIKGYTAIPVGTYKMTLSMSAHFGKVLPELHDVPGYEGVRIHSGNTSADTEGCLLLGLYRVGGTISSSRHAFMVFMNAIKGMDNLTIEISGLPNKE